MGNVENTTKFSRSKSISSISSDTSQYKSTRVQHESTQIDMSSIRVNTNQHEPKTSLDHKK